MNLKFKKQFSRLFAFLCVLLLGICLFEGGNVLASSPDAREGVYVYDGAGLFSSEERESLQEYFLSIEAKEGFGVYVITSDASGNGESDRYLEDFYDEGYDSGEIRVDAVLMHIDMESRYVNIQAYGAAESKIDDQNADYILGEIMDELRNGDYYAACRKYADKAVEYWNYVPIFLRAIPQLVFSLIVGGIAVGVMVANSSGKMTANGLTYMDSQKSGIKARRDDYIRTTVTKRKKPQSNGGGGGGGHRSSGGHSHSSAGRHF